MRRSLTTSTESGRAAEQSAWHWLALQSGNRVLLARNFRTRIGEIDLIFEEWDEGEWTLVFLEVRSRARAHGHAHKRGGYRPIDTVDGLKRQKIERTATVYLLQYRGQATRIRMDCLELTGEPASREFVWWRNAW